jgi:ribose 5-phosphate isomerase B
MAKELITERNVLDAASRGATSISVGPGAIVTASARDRASQLGIAIETRKPEKKGPPVADTPGVVQPREGETIAIGSDHGGFQLKALLKPFLEGLGYTLLDVGTATEDACDYPDFAFAVAMSVASGQASRGIMIDSVGVASAMAANKVPGIRAACCPDLFTAKSSREHNNANVLTLGGKTLGTELAKAIVKEWLQTWYGGGRHEKRVQKITEIEKKYLKG